MSDINWKSKYLELRDKYTNDLDVAFRLGFEAGAQQAQQQQAMEAQAQAQQMQAQQAQIEAQGMGGQEAPQEDGQQMESGQEMSQSSESGQPGQGSELDQHIGKLESMLGSNPNPEMQKSLQAIVSLRKAEKTAFDLKKNELAIKGIAKALHKPKFKMSVQAAHNMKDSAKQAVSLQHKIVNDVMKAWETEESKSSKDIKTILSVDNLLGK